MADNPITEAAKAIADSDYVGTPPEDNWDLLSGHDQLVYATQACRTAGAIYETHVSESQVSIKVTLPESMRIRGLTQAHVERLERVIHSSMEEAIVQALKNREFFMRCGAEAAAHYRAKGQPIPESLGYCKGDFQ